MADPVDYTAFHLVAGPQRIHHDTAVYGAYHPLDHRHAPLHDHVGHFSHMRVMAIISCKSLIDALGGTAPP